MTDGNGIPRPRPGPRHSQLLRHGFWYGMPGACSCHWARVIAAPVTAQSRLATAAGSVLRKTTEKSADTGEAEDVELRAVAEVVKLCRFGKQASSPRSAALVRRRHRGGPDTSRVRGVGDVPPLQALVRDDHGVLPVGQHAGQVRTGVGHRDRAGQANPESFPDAPQAQQSVGAEDSGHGRGRVGRDDPVRRGTISMEL